MVTNGIIFGILLGVVGLGYLFRAGLFVILAGLGMVIFGFSLWALYGWLSIIVVIAGIILVWLGIRS